MRWLTAYGNLDRAAAKRIRVPGSMHHQLTIRPSSRLSCRVRAGLLAVPLLLAMAVAPAWSQTQDARKPRRQFLTVSYESFVTQPLHFERFPLEDLVGGPVASSQFKDYDYETRDGLVLIDVVNFKRRGHGAGISIYPFGMSVGPALALRASVQELPDLSITFSGRGAPPNYELTGARAYDVGAAIIVADRSRGWGLGSQAFVGGGRGKIHAGTRTGDRIFAEGGGGVSSGPFGVELSVKFAWNHLSDPVDHHFITVPVTLRGTLSV
jgi:hypothetical protein